MNHPFAAWSLATRWNEDAASYFFHRMCVYVLMNLGEDAAIAAWMFC
jgi:hypothetical protein